MILIIIFNFPFSSKYQFPLTKNKIPWLFPDLDEFLFFLTISWSVATLPVIKNVDNPLNQWKLKRNTNNRQKAQGNECERVTIGFGFIHDYMTK